MSIKGKIRSTEMASELGVSEVTIRSDLSELEQEGLLKRVHGGAIQTKLQRYDPEFQEKVAIDVDEKRHIALKATKFVEKYDVIFIDAGSTTLFFFEELSKNPPTVLTVVTNSLYIINAVVQYPNINLVVIGGTFQHNTMNFLDFEINPFLNRYNVNKVFLGVNGFDETGYYASNILEAETKKLICNACDEIFILATSSKHFKRSLVLTQKWTGKERIITSDLTEDNRTRLMELAKNNNLLIY
ncbi:MAG: DeoR/GlpR transcriptional regulator [Mesotoga sp.]|nr:DeoR/GlpR transcriptional regulator [Mesotoga sp.]NLI08193.1 DeoR/GlpR transcriptional regulator [Thermotogaceae bacterium]